MRARLLVALMAVIAATGFAPVPKPKDKGPAAKGLVKALQGTWRMTAMERGAEKDVLKAYDDITITVKGDRWSQVMTVHGKTFESPAATFSLDTSKKPAWITITFTDPGATKLSGVFRVEGDTLVVAYMVSYATGANAQGAGDDRPRPEGLDKVGPSQFRYTLRRVKR